MPAGPPAAVLLAALAGCGDGAAPAVPAEVRATSGGGQIAAVKTMLPAPLIATVVDEAGNPVHGVKVGWSSRGAGRIEPDSVITDIRGRAEARWVLGEEPGVASALASVLSLPSATFSAVAEPADGLPPGEIRVLSLATYEGSGQVVHPDYARSPAGAFAYGHHLAITPYPFGNAAYENPSLFASLGRRDAWLLEAGTHNPVARPESGHLSDPDMLFVPEANELWLYYRQAARDNVVLLIRSTDGRTWSEPAEVARRPSHEIVSPTVVRKGPSEWYMWAVNSGPSGCGASSATVELRRSADGRRWSAPEPLDFPLPELWPWHIEVQWIPSRGEFWAVSNAKTSSGCTTPAVFIARSPDGVRWTVSGHPVIAKGRIPEFEHIVYRSTFDYEPAEDLVTFWYSGARFEGSDYVWRAAVERRARGEVFAAAKIGLDRSIYDPPPAPLHHWP
ncbi:MAG: hypothetical protein ACREM9_11130 [Gemmatimonadales bacterium]